MAKSVYKYTLESKYADVQIIHMPKGFNIVHLAMQGDDICFWAEIDREEQTEAEAFLVLGTGWDIPVDAVHVGTVQIPP
jgi:hypothetical protein